MGKYNVVNTDCMAGTQVGSLLKSAKFYNAADALTEIDNGMVVKIGALLNGEREIHKATTPAANTPINEIGLVASPEYMADERKHSLSDYTNEAGTTLRVYKLHDGDFFGATVGCFTATPVKGNIVELAAGTKWKVVSTATDNSTQVGIIDDIYTIDGITYYGVSVRI